MRRKLMIVLVALFVVVVLSMINSMFVTTTGGAIYDISVTYPGLSYVFVIIISIAAIVMVRHTYSMKK